MHENIVIMQMWCNAWNFKLNEATPNQIFLHKLINFEKPLKILQKSKLRSEKNEKHD